MVGASGTRRPGCDESCMEVCTLISLSFDRDQKAYSWFSTEDGAAFFFSIMSNARAETYRKKKNASPYSLLITGRTEKGKENKEHKV